MKGQAINIDWVIGLSLFLAAVVGAAFAAVTPGAGLLDAPDRLGDTAETLNTEIVSDTSVNYFESSIVTRGPDIGRIPVARSYYYSDDAENRTGTLEPPGAANVSENKLYAAVRTGNTSERFGYFGKGASSRSPSGYLSVSSSWINSSNFSVKIDTPGIKSIRYNGQELMGDATNLESTDYTVVGDSASAEALSGQVRAVTNTSEIVLTDLDGANFELGNFSTLYWEEDNSTVSMSSPGTYRDGSTLSLTVAGFESGDESMTFSGDMNATVTRDSGDDVEVSVESERARLRLHEGGVAEGYRRALFERNGWVTVIPEKRHEMVYSEELQALSSLSDEEFSDRYDLETKGYNVTFNGSWGDPLPLEDITVRTRMENVVDRDGKITREELSTAVWE
jgi:hypothetical protein